MVGNILAVGLMSLGMGMSGVKDEPQMYAQDESTYSITYNPISDFEERAQDIYDWLVEEDISYSKRMAITGSITLTGIPSSTLQDMWYGENTVNLRTNAAVNYIYTLTTETWNESTVEAITITSQAYYEALHEEPPSMGDSIIGSIASGLGLIGALATEFLAGFGALFYVQGALTPFAIFSLVMLGVAVSFAVVKLVLNLIRSNTGA